MCTCSSPNSSAVWALSRLVSAHGNSLRSIAKDLDDLDDEAVTRLEIPTGVPIVYEMADGKPVDKRIVDG